MWRSIKKVPVWRQRMLHSASLCAFGKRMTNMLWIKEDEYENEDSWVSQLAHWINVEYMVLPENIFWIITSCSLKGAWPYKDHSSVLERSPANPEATKKHNNSMLDMFNWILNQMKYTILQCASNIFYIKFYYHSLSSLQITHSNAVTRWPNLIKHCTQHSSDWSTNSENLWDSLWAFIARIEEKIDRPSKGHRAVCAKLGWWGVNNAHCLAFKVLLWLCLF